MDVHVVTPHGHLRASGKMQTVSWLGTTGRRSGIIRLARRIEMKRVFHLLVVGFIITGTSWAAGDPFAGTWKLDSARSQFPPDTMRVESAGANKYTFIFAEPTAETIVLDGTDQAAAYDSTLSVAEQGSRVWSVVRKSKGRVIISAHWTLSEDSRTLHDSYTEYKSDGSPFTVDYLYLRKGGGQGFAGTWQSTSEIFVTPYVIEIRPYQGDGFSLIDPVARIDKSVKFDGKDYPNSGPNASADMTSSGRRVSERHLELTDKLKDKVQSIDDFQLSNDLRTMTEIQHPANQGKPVILVFQRE
jgi:hypothetical protein